MSPTISSESSKDGVHVATCIEMGLVATANRREDLTPIMDKLTRRRIIFHDNAIATRCLTAECPRSDRTYRLGYSDANSRHEGQNHANLSGESLRSHNKLQIDRATQR